ncbi:hypothetical protein SAMN04487950_1201 [Halogranum rubrum]|uniref:DUF1684 domain-containing protein n=1 Tax=Halogranum rubrum TaxID=553466 RepID=A0A1I4CLW1_9EURY|nr:DUF1684 domain-containing protein [Halogranum rubrum]SFK80941.1 hypothetical protein SAMN04487950_1201 [Halogranum rubrum]
MNDTAEFDVDEWAARLQENRTQKDEFFAEHPQSPIPPEDRETFDGLSYFDPDPTYRVECHVEVHDDPEADPIEMDTSAGPNVRYLRVATFEFDIDGTEQTLTAYQQAVDEDEPLFVPFRDKTTGQQTYSDGRYMEFEAERALADGDTFTLDFNLAYSPFCAYSETFACPLPPEENWLDVVIPAGERYED